MKHKETEQYKYGTSDNPKVGDGPILKRASMADQGARRGQTAEANRFGQKLSDTSYVPLEEMPAERADPESILMRAEEELGHNVFRDDYLAIEDDMLNIEDEDADEVLEDEIVTENEDNEKVLVETSKKNGSNGVVGDPMTGFEVPDLTKKDGYKRNISKRSVSPPIRGAKRPKYKTEDEERRI